MKKLPQRFLDDMKELLMDEYDDFIKSYDEPKTTGLRINTLKINNMRLIHVVDFSLVYLLPHHNKIYIYIIETK